MILFQDLVDGAGIEKNIARLEAANQKFADSAVKQNDRVRQSMLELKTELLGYKTELTGLIPSVAGAGRGLAGLKDDVAYTTRAYRENETALQRNRQLLDLNTASVVAIRARLRDLKAEYESLDRTQAGNQTRMRAIKGEVDQVNAVLKSLTLTTRQAAKSVDVAEASYARLDRQTQQLKADLKAMPNAFDAVTGRINQNNQAAKEMLARIQANDRALKGMDASMGVHNRNVGNYGATLKDMAGQLIGVTSVVGGIGMAFAALQGGLGIIQDMERIDAGLKAVSRDNDDFARSQQFLLALSDKLGIGYGELAGAYKGLKAATKDTALEGRNTEKIFAAVATAGAKLQLSAEDVTGTLRALEQMISKGHISAEELRGQLGERLPGAIRLMSEALGVSETKLNKMMEQGQLIATEVMPAFAGALDKAYGLEQSQKIDTMAASTNRLNNEFNQTVKQLGEDTKVTKFFSAITNGIATTLKAVRTFNQSGDWKTWLSSWSHDDYLKKRSQPVRDEFASLDAGKRRARLDLLKEQEARETAAGETGKARRTAELIRDLSRENLKLELAERKEKNRQVAIEERNAVEKNETDLTRFQKQAVRKRTAEILALEKQVAANPKNEVLAKKLEVYQRLDAEQRAQEKAVTDRIKSQKPKKPNDDTQLETIDKQIKSIEKTLQTEAMRDLKAGRLIDVDPKLTARVAELKKQYEAIKAMQEAIEKGVWNKKVTYDVSAITPVGGVNELMAGDKKGRALSPAAAAANDEKQLARFKADMERTVNIMAEYAARREKLTFDTSNRLFDLRAEQKAELYQLLRLQEAADRNGHDAEVENLQRVIEQKKALYQQDYMNRKAVRDKSIEIGVALVNGLFEIEQAASQNRLAMLDKEKERELANAGDNANAKAAIERKYDEQRKQIQHQQDVQARNQALFNVAVSTATAVAEALPNIPLSIAVGILGAVQAGIILAKPLPQYADGKNVGNTDTYAGPALVGEAGRELWVHDGRVDLVDQATVLNVGRNDRILPNALTERLLSDEHAMAASAILGRNRAMQRAGEQLAAGRDAHQARLMSRAMGSGLSADAIGRAVARENAKLPFNHTTFDGRGVTDYVTEGNTRRTVQAKKHQLK